MSMACAADPSLLAAVRRSGRARSLRAALLVAPAAAFLAIVFLVPIIGFMFRSLDNAEVPSALPRTSAALAAWDAKAFRARASSRRWCSICGPSTGQPRLPWRGA